MQPAVICLTTVLLEGNVCVQDICSVLARDGNNLTPLTLALRNKRSLCASFLLTKQWSKVRLKLTVQHLQTSLFSR